MADGVKPRQHQPPPLQKSIKSELDEWSLGKFSKMNFWRRGHGFGETSISIFKYSGEDILQNGILDVESRLGEGGMGQVYFARNKEDGTTVAVKVGKEDPDRIGIKSQLAEIVARDRLPGDGHKNLVTAYGFCDRTPGCPIFLEACSGGDLFEAAVEGHHMKNVEVLGLVQDVVSALGFLHEHGIIHCDVKAENILLQANGNGGYTPKLTDFGGSMAAGEDRQGGGTFGYTAPEVIFGTRRAHGSQDTWAVGHMLLVVLTKRRYRNSNMFKHSRLLTEGDHELKVTMARHGEEDVFERYVTFRNMRDLSTLDTLLSKDMFDEDLAKVPQVFTGIRQLLHLEAAKRPPMAVVHGWLGLVITGLDVDAVDNGGPSPDRIVILDDCRSKERLPHSPRNPLKSTGTRTEARLPSPLGSPLGSPPGSRITGTKGMPPLPPPPSPPDVPVSGIKNDPRLRPPPGFPPIGAAKNVPSDAPPAAGVAAATHQEHVAPVPLANGSARAIVGAENEARIPTSTATCGEIESCPSTTSTVAETESVAALASRFDKLRDQPPQDVEVPASAQQPRGGEPAAAVRPTGRETLIAAAKAAAAQAAAQRARHYSGVYRNGVEGCSRPGTAVLGMGVFPAAIRQYDVTPRASGAAFCGIDQRHAPPAPATGVHGRSVPRAFQATNAAIPPAYCYHHGAAPPSYHTRGGHGVSAAGFGADGGPSSRPPPSRAPGWTGQGGGYGRWTGDNVAGAPSASYLQQGNVFQNRSNVGGVHVYGHQRPPSAWNRNNPHPHNGYTQRAGGPGKNRTTKSKNRRGRGENNMPSGRPQHFTGSGNGVGCHAGLAVPHAIAVNGAAFYCPPGGEGIYPSWQWQGQPVRAW